jgi:flagellar biosynthesis protein
MLPYKENKAVALKYDSEKENAPVVVASGYGEVAKNIIAVAEKNGIPVYRDDSAASLMCMLKVGSNIPPELYEVIASIYVSILKSSDSLRKKLMNETEMTRNDKST